jgi:hypothetical protein
MSLSQFPAGADASGSDWKARYPNWSSNIKVLPTGIPLDRPLTCDSQLPEFNLMLIEVL